MNIRTSVFRTLAVLSLGFLGLAAAQGAEARSPDPPNNYTLCSAELAAPDAPTGSQELDIAMNLRARSGVADKSEINQAFGLEPPGTTTSDHTHYLKNDTKKNDAIGLMGRRSSSPPAIDAYEDAALQPATLRNRVGNSVMQSAKRTQAALKLSRIAGASAQEVHPEYARTYNTALLRR